MVKQKKLFRNDVQKKVKPSPKMKKSKRIKSEDVYNRLNYLYQAAHLVRHQPALSRFYLDILRKTATRSVLRLDPAVKHTICRVCSSLLTPGESALVRIKKKPEPHCIYTCLFCHSNRYIGLREKGPSIDLAAENPSHAEAESDTIKSKRLEN